MPNVETLDAYVDATHYTLGKFYRPEDMHIGNLLTALSCLDAGTTTIIDASHNARSPDHTDASMRSTRPASARSTCPAARWPAIGPSTGLMISNA
jgi:5-methylthioadenosine/S-adenosylhomocysteine deaminase